MTKTELVKSLMQKTESDKKTIENVLSALDETILNECRTGGKVPLMSIGSISIKDRAARVARNPATGESVQVPAKRIPKFTFSKAFKDQVL